ncbi:MAG: TatD family hydrolase [Bryobacteraceae bacterium]|nr:TatD family hydrolase [Bryobacteraceae bacterium]
MIDSHCHVDDSDFDADREAVIARARAAGVSRFLAIGSGDGPPDLEAGIRLAERYSDFVATVGVHPHKASVADAETFSRLPGLCQHPKVVALGEIGLDYHYDFAPRDTQHDVFVRQMDVAREAGLPIIIHSREAWDDTFSLLEKHWPAGLGGIFHCFSGGVDEMRRAVSLGFSLGFGGVLTYPKATNVHEAAREAPAEKLLLETDCPYLAPVPFRGKRNEPAYVQHTAARLAELRGVTLSEIDQLTTANFARLFPRAALKGTA